MVVSAKYPVLTCFVVKSLVFGSTRHHNAREKLVKQNGYSHLYRHIYSI
nr:MAG TPA: hypothetical protein [Caudoviricetes sp.]